MIDRRRQASKRIHNMSAPNSQSVTEVVIIFTVDSKIAFVALERGTNGNEARNYGFTYSNDCAIKCGYGTQSGECLCLVGNSDGEPGGARE